MPTFKKKKEIGGAKTEKKLIRISQSDVPAYSLSKALVIATAIAENYGYKPTAPLKVAQAMNMSPTSGTFRMLCGASMGYGITEGGYNASAISITPLGLKIVKPKTEDEELQGKREAFLKPKVVNDFLKKYQGSSLPREEIALNVLDETGVPKERGKEVLKFILEEAALIGFLREIKGKKYVDLESPNDEVESNQEDEGGFEDVERGGDEGKGEGSAILVGSSIDKRNGDQIAIRKKKVFITHGKNQAFIDPIKKLLSFGELEPVVSVEKQTVSQPVPGKVMDDMRACGGAIIHIDAEQKLMDSSATEHVVLNPNVLIEIGAALALYGRRFILLVKDGVKLPSNLQGLYVVSYSNDALDGNTTIKLLESINDLKRQKLPEEISE